MKWEPIKQFMYSRQENASEKLFNTFIKTFRFDCYMRNPYPRNFKKFIYGDRSYNAGNMLDELPPYKDHAIAFRKKGTRLIAYVFHPYCYTEKQEQELEDYCWNRDICYIIYPTEYSFYNPGSTKMVVLMSRETYNNYFLTGKNLKGAKQNVQSRFRFI